MAAVVGPQLGVNGKLYINAAIAAAPVWVIVLGVKDVSIPWKWGDGDATTRAGGAFKQYEPTLADLSCSLEFLYNPGGDAVMNTFVNAALNRLPVDLVALDQDKGIAAAQGTRCAFKVFSMERKEPLDNLMTKAFELKPCIYSVLPAYVVF